MSRIDPQTLLEKLRWRYATKAFDPRRKIDPATWSALEEILVISPSSFGLQPWKFIVITNQEVKERLVPLSWNQQQVADASHVVVFCVKHPISEHDVRRHVERTASVRGIEPQTLAGFQKVMLDFVNAPGFELKSWAAHQVYIALGNFMTSAAALDIDTCPMEGLEPSGYDRVLGLEGTGFFTVAACPAGYRAADDKYAALPKVRFNAEDVIHRIP